MREVIISEEALQDLKEHLSYIVIRDGIDRAESINDQIIDKIYELLSLQLNWASGKMHIFLE